MDGQRWTAYGHAVYCWTNYLHAHRCVQSTYLRRTSRGVKSEARRIQHWPSACWHAVAPQKSIVACCVLSSSVDFCTPYCQSARCGVGPILDPHPCCAPYRPTAFGGSTRRSTSSSSPRAEPRRLSRPMVEDPASRPPDHCGLPLLPASIIVEQSSSKLSMRLHL
jgi:hypothetical protein